MTFTVSFESADARQLCAKVRYGALDLQVFDCYLEMIGISSTEERWGLRGTVIDSFGDFHDFLDQLPLEKLTELFEAFADPLASVLYSALLEERLQTAFAELKSLSGDERRYDARSSRVREWNGPLTLESSP